MEDKFAATVTIFSLCIVVFALFMSFKRKDSRITYLEGVVKEQQIKARADSIAHETRLHNCWAEVGKK